MGFPITAAEYAAYLTLAAQKIEAEKEYISALDAATGDGDHWANLNTGFERLVREREELAALPLSACFQRIGMLMMNSIGGSSGILYGGAYMAAARTLRGKEVIDREALGQVLQAMVEDMCTRGGSKPGYKTMIDALYPAAETYRQLAERGRRTRSFSARSSGPRWRARRRQRRWKRCGAAPIISRIRAWGIWTRAP